MTCEDMRGVIALRRFDARSGRGWASLYASATRHRRWLRLRRQMIFLGPMLHWSPPGFARIEGVTSRTRPPSLSPAAPTMGVEMMILTRRSAHTIDGRRASAFGHDGDDFFMPRVRSTAITP